VDDAILLHALKHDKTQQGVLAGIATEDMGMRIKCTTHGIRAICPDLTYRLPNPRDDLIRSQQQAEAELKRLRSASPRVDALVSTCQSASPSQELTIQIPEADAPLDVDHELESLEQEYPHLSESSLAVRRPDLAVLHGILGDPREHIRAYNNDLDLFYEKYRSYLQCINDQRLCKPLIVQFTLWLDNAGSCPAEDIDASFRLPNKFHALINNQDLDERPSSLSQETLNMRLYFESPSEPTPPIHPEKRTRSKLSDLMSSSLRPPDFHNWVVPSMGGPTTEIERNESFAIIHSLARLKHNYQHRIGTFLALFKSPDSVSSFEIPYTISLGNHPDLIEGRVLLHLRPAQ